MDLYKMIFSLIGLKKGGGRLRLSPFVCLLFLGLVSSIDAATTFYVSADTG